MSIAAVWWACWGRPHGVGDLVIIRGDRRDQPARDRVSSARMCARDSGARSRATGPLARPAARPRVRRPWAEQPEPCAQVRSAGQRSGDQGRGGSPRPGKRPADHAGGRPRTATRPTENVLRARSEEIASLLGDSDSHMTAAQFKLASERGAGRDPRDRGRDRPPVRRSAGSALAGSPTSPTGARVLGDREHRPEQHERIAAPLSTSTSGGGVQAA